MMVIVFPFLYSVVCVNIIRAFRNTRLFDKKSTKGECVKIIRNQIHKDLKKIGVLAKIEKHFSFHTARHTNATLLIYNGAQITTVQKLLGHQSVKTTQGYSDIFSGTIVKDLKKCKF